MQTGKTTPRASQGIRYALLVFLVVMVSLPAFSQSCALCYTQAASAGARMIQALKSGILILITPPTVMSLVVIGICCRKSKQFRAPAGEDESSKSW